MLVETTFIDTFCNDLREIGKRIVFTNGCFDILHIGHIRYLTAAKELGKKINAHLIVGLNSDSSVKILKGENRPINNEDDRAEMLLALKAVDHVVIFSDKTAEDLIKKIKPEIYVKGGDYNWNNLPEAKIVESYGGRVEFIKFVDDHSTTKLIEKINRNN